MSKRVCFIRQSVFPYELSFRREVDALNSQGFEVHVICLDGQEFDPKHKLEEVIDQVIVHRIPLTRKKSSIARYLYDYFSFFFLAAIKLTILHLRLHFDAIQVNTMPDFLVFATLIPRLMGARVTVMMQEPVPELWQTLHHSPPPRLLMMVEQATLAYVDKAFTVTEQLREVYINRGAKDQKISVILNTPDSRFLRMSEDLGGLEPDPKLFTLISHGAIEERYGHDTMLEAVAILKEEIPNLRLKILGKGSYLDEFLCQIHQKVLGDFIQYLGRVPLERLIIELLTSDVGIVAQKSSPYSNLVHTNKMYEFIALGKPVLASRLKSVQAYFDEESLYYFTPGNPESLAMGILDLYQHPWKRKNLVENSQKIYSYYMWEKQKRTYQSIYLQLVNDHLRAGEE